jgi:hypothetical protein
MNYKPVLAVIVLLIFVTAIASAISLMLFQAGVFD